MRRTTNPQFLTVTIPTPGGVLRAGSMRLNLEHYDPSAAEQTRQGWKLTLRTQQVVTVDEDKALLDQEYARYLDYKASRA